MLYVRLIMGLLNNRVLVWLSVHLYEEVVIDNLTLKDSTAVSSLKKAIVLKCWITFELVILPVCFKNTCKVEFLIFCSCITHLVWPFKETHMVRS